MPEKSFGEIFDFFYESRLFHDQITLPKVQNWNLGQLDRLPRVARVASENHEETPS